MSNVSEMIGDQKLYNNLIERVSREFTAGRPLSIGNHLNKNFDEGAHKMYKGKEKRSKSPLKKARGAKTPINIGIKCK